MYFYLVLINKTTNEYDFSFVEYDFSSVGIDYLAVPLHHMMHVKSVWCVAYNLHMTAPWTRESAWWRRVWWR